MCSVLWFTMTFPIPVAPPFQESGDLEVLNAATSFGLGERSSVQTAYHELEDWFRFPAGRLSLPIPGYLARA
jgi:hypothetical protein